MDRYEAILRDWDLVRRQEEQMLAAGNLPASPLIRAFVPQVKAVDADRRTVSHLISDDSIDRAGDIIESTGWQLENYRKNPRVMRNHSYRVEDIIGRGKVKAQEDGLYATTEFTDAPVGVAAFDAVAGGWAGAWSVGFKPVEWHPVSKGAGEDMACEKCIKAKRRQKGRDYVYGVHFTKQELLEYSLVAIPANPACVMAMVQAGLTAPPRSVPGHGELFLDAQESETVERALDVLVADRERKRLKAVGVPLTDEEAEVLREWLRKEGILKDGREAAGDRAPDGATAERRELTKEAEVDLRSMLARVNRKATALEIGNVVSTLRGRVPQ
jgi:phage head maturation protease